MGRYAIVDDEKALAFIDKLSEVSKDSAFHKGAVDLVINTLLTFKRECIFSKEESEAKFKEVFEAGSDDSYFTTNDRCDWETAPPTWDEFKTTL